MPLTFDKHYTFPDDLRAMLDGTDYIIVGDVYGEFICEKKTSPLRGKALIVMFRFPASTRNAPRYAGRMYPDGGALGTDICFTDPSAADDVAKHLITRLLIGEVNFDNFKWETHD